MEYMFFSAFREQKKRMKKTKKNRFMVSSQITQSDILDYSQLNAKKNRADSARFKKKLSVINGSIRQLELTAHL